MDGRMESTVHTAAQARGVDKARIYPEKTLDSIWRAGPSGLTQPDSERSRPLAAARVRP